MEHEQTAWTRASRRRWTAAAAAAATVGALALAAIPAGATTTATATRLGGNDRFETAAAIARNTYASAPTVLLATGERFPDALAGGALAGEERAPILLVGPNAIPAATTSALQSLKTSRIFLLGGPAAISEAVRAELAKTYTVSRIGGNDRYETAANVARTLNAGRIGAVNGRRSALLGTGLNFADHVSAGALAAFGQLPALLTTPGSLPAATKNALKDLQIENVLVLGGPDAVSTAVEDQVKAMGITTRRIAGNNRVETAARIADFEVDEFGFSADHANLATGSDFADALAGGPHGGGTEMSPVLLTASSSDLGAATDAWLRAHCSTVNSLHVFGLDRAVNATTVNAAEMAARSC